MQYNKQYSYVKFTYFNSSGNIRVLHDMRLFAHEIILSMVFCYGVCVCVEYIITCGCASTECPKKTPPRFHVHLLHSGRGEWWEQSAFYETHLSQKLKCPERREFLYFLNTLNYCQQREFFLNQMFTRIAVTSTIFIRSL